ncbi:hypothetical protein MRX96_004416 [Rhipicephalus microplus]
MSAADPASPLRQWNSSTPPSAAQASASDFISDAFNFVSASSERKLAVFQDEEIADGGTGPGVVICEIQALTRLVSSARCGTERAGNANLWWWRFASKRKGLASLIELRCTNGACPAAAVSAVYSSERTGANGCEGSDTDR